MEPTTTGLMNEFSTSSFDGSTNAGVIALSTTADVSSLTIVVSESAY